MNRRSAIRQFLYISIGATIFPSCLNLASTNDRATGSVKEGPEHLKFDQKEQSLVSALADVIIPGGKTPGAKDLGADTFVLTMVNDCMSRKEQESWYRGLKAFETASQNNHGQTFLSSNQQEREEVLSKLESNKNKEDKSDLAFFYHTSKKLVIEGYCVSKYYMTQVKIYELVPARFHGCVPVKSVLRKIS